ncbi:glycoside hydrolase family 99-like domain-containing protein [Botrimarina sp.]|uniref:glycoside hydrolase family 99-like domain-containing protein n=1 Tax=Botrimarina sp. TaxID=2795802 RepID=UPI0032EF1493
MRSAAVGGAAVWLAGGAVWLASCTVSAASQPGDNSQPGDKEYLVGVTYFAGWWEPTPNKWHSNISGEYRDWREGFPERKPLLGEYNTQPTMDAEIAAAAEHGVDFFNILWYPQDGPVPGEPHAAKLNSGLEHFVRSPQSDRLSFCLEVCNHPPFDALTDASWADCEATLLAAFRQPSYLRVGGKLVLKIHSSQHFLQAHGGDVGPAAARLERLRQVVRENGLGELLIGGGLTGWSSPADQPWFRTLFDYGSTYMALPEQLPRTPHDLPYGIISRYTQAYRMHGAEAGFPIVPFVTAGWNSRPWDYPTRPCFELPTEEQFRAELRAVREDLDAFPTLGFPTKDATQKAFVIYAWNEFGEGGFIAPTEGWGTSRLRAIRDEFAADETRVGKN